MATVLVTGGAGFIGSHACDALLSRGDHVICTDCLNDFYPAEIKLNNISHSKKNPNFELFIYNIENKDEIEVLFRRKIDKILHLAARAGVRPSLERPLDYVRSNLVGTANILELARKCNIKDVVVASSSSVYGKHERSAFKEDDNTDFPLSPYAATKKGCEALCHSYANMCDLNVTCLRFFTVYGPRNRPDMAMFTFAKAIQEGKEIPVYGENTKRDWTFISDIVDGTIKALDHPQKFEIINLGNSNPVLVTYVIELLEEELGNKAITRREPLPVGDVPITYADISKAERLLGWKPTTSIEDGVKRFVEWFKQQSF